MVRTLEEQLKLVRSASGWNRGLGPSDALLDESLKTVAPWRVALLPGTYGFYIHQHANNNKRRRSACGTVTSARFLVSKISVRLAALCILLPKRALSIMLQTNVNAH
jgi:hypothetical protein